MNFLDHSLFKENIPLLILVLYLLRDRLKTGNIFKGVVVCLYMFIPVFSLIYIILGNPFNILSFSWNTWITPVQYCLLLIIGYELSLNRTNDIPFSVTLSFHLASASGYLYEAPRYLRLQGWGWVVRYNKYSVFVVTYSIISLAVIVWLLSEQFYRITKPVMLSLFGYSLYTVLYYHNFYWIHALRKDYIWFLGYDIPWINLFRLPTMFFLLSLTRGIKND